MNIFRYVKNVANLNYAYWNDTHNSVFNDLWCKIERLKKNEAIIAKKVITDTCLLNETLWGPDRYRNMLFNKISDDRMKSMNSTRVLGLYEACFKMYYRILSMRDNELLELCRSSFESLFDKPLDHPELFDEVSDNIKLIIDKGLDDYVERSEGLFVIPDPGLTFSFSSIVSLGISRTFESLHEESQKYDL